MKPLQLALIGLGTVGTGVAKILTEHAERTSRRAGRPIEIRHAVVKNPDKPREIELPAGVVHTDVDKAINDPEVDVVVELIGGISPAREIVLNALKAGKSVVTANKALMCEYGDELFPVAREHGCTIGFEAAVAGGVPIVSGIGQALSGNQVTSIEAILNGTSNFILTRMLDADISYEEAVSEAQALGYAEADPAMDVDGTDAAQKLSLLMLLAGGTRIRPADFTRQGIDRLDLADLQYADELGYAVKLLAIAKLIDDRLEMHVQPTLVKYGRPLSAVDGPQNMIVVEADAVGKVWFAGPGAGMMPTASAVMADIIDAATGRAAETFRTLDLFGEGEPRELVPPSDVRMRYYFRFHVEDRPHVLADIADILGRNKISLASVMQHEAPEVEEGEIDSPFVVPLVVMTHHATEGQVGSAEKELMKLAALRNPWVRMAVAD
ncbi:homoserine dehydrogenase [Stratiformator vulcanicus]|uniref:Homoserine dehydrogenase n=1 Tax=Stratiformator vulcanicus TaxID=2527980 RepID=A0A517R6U3_9PLAN|nr:homoserine dehydrogenase [Stratiformator vulcanicus]QDT39551.1 Homoserine dehydrogenase [Stratiformator vulcanicus]